MKIQPTNAERDGEGTTLDVSSLIDICFLLLIYFLVATTLQKKEQDLPMRLPADQRAQAPTHEIEPLLIAVDRRGVIRVGDASGAMVMDEDGSSRELPLLTQWLRPYADSMRAQGRVPLVQLAVDREATQQRVMDVLNVLAGEKIPLATLMEPRE